MMREPTSLRSPHIRSERARIADLAPPVADKVTVAPFARGVTAREVPAGTASAALLVQGVTGTISRWQAGRQGDRYGHTRLLIPAIVTCALGLAGLTWLGSPAAVLIGLALFGAGFGVAENSTFALLLERLPEDKASALWNLAYDAGYGAGPVAFGLVSARTGYPLGFALTGALVLAALPAALRGRRADKAGS